MSDEQVVLSSDQVFRWEGPKRKQTLLKAKLGRLVLTDQRLLFLSTGKNDLTASRVLGGAVSPMAGLTTGSTGQLDLAAVNAPGGLEVPRARVRSAELKGMFKVLTVSWQDDAGEVVFSTFAPKNGGMPDGARWVEELGRASDPGS